MNVLIVYCNPEPCSFNGSLRGAAVRTFKRRGDDVVVSGVYVEGFDPIEKTWNYETRFNVDRFDNLSEQRHEFQTNTIPEEVFREIRRLEACNLLVLQYPLWWHQQPAMLKEWFDRLFVAGGLYISTMCYDRGYFKGKKAFCSG